MDPFDNSAILGRFSPHFGAHFLLPTQRSPLCLFNSSFAVFPHSLSHHVLFAGVFLVFLFIVNNLLLQRIVVSPCLVQLSLFGQTRFSHLNLLLLICGYAVYAIFHQLDVVIDIFSSLEQSELLATLADLFLFF